MRSLGVRSVVLLVGTTLLMVAMVAPASAARRVGAPWVVAASPTSMTLDWSGGGSFRVYSSRQGGGSKHVVRASGSKRKVTGLRPGTMYCFQVARSNGSGRSKAFCHTTPARARARRAASLSIVTFNVCSTVCGHWSGRRAAVVRRILESKADVVTLQEVSRHVPELVELLQPHGFDLMAESGNEAIFGRRHVVQRAVGVGPGCARDVEQLLDSPVRGWEKGQTPIVGGTTWSWNESLQLWIGDSVSCRDGRRRWVARPFGRTALPNDRSAAFAAVLDVRSGRYVTVVTTHLTPGSSMRAARKRLEETKALVGTRDLWSTVPVIYAGDFNASRGRGHDFPEHRLAKARMVDAYDRSTSFTNAWMSSSNGFASRPRRSVRYGDHIDRIFVPRGFGVSNWKVVAPLRRGRNVRPIASDHNPVRATVWLP